MARVTRLVRGGLSAATVFAIVGLVGPRFGASASATSAPPNLSAACGLATGTQYRALVRTEPCVISLAVGDSFRLALDKSFRWGGLHASSGAVHESTASGPPSGGLSSIVTARSVGRVTLSATGVMVCAPGVACPALARLWVLQVVVTASRSTPVNLAVAVTDSGRQYYLRVGDHLLFKLVGPGAYLWKPLVSSAPKVLAVVSSRGGSVAYANVVGRSPGRSVASAIDNPRCYPQCLPPSRIFQVSVIVAR